MANTTITTNINGKNTEICAISVSNNEKVGIPTYEALLTLLNDAEDTVKVYDKETGKHYNKKIFRKYKSYGVTPKFDADNPKSYMFSEHENVKSEAIPAMLHKLLEGLNAPPVQVKFNNCVINWYKDGNDYIEMHGDCTSSWNDNGIVVIVNVNETENDCRQFVLENRNGNDIHSFKLLNNMIVVLDKENQKMYRHGVPKAPDIKTGRISLTFRSIKED